MTDDSAPRPPVDRRRIPLERKVSLKFKEFRGFITEYSSNISNGGMFIRTTDPQPPGSVFDFELKLADEFSLVNGIGEVAWVRREAAGPDAPTGMGVRFLQIDEAGRKLVERMVSEHAAAGGTVFSVDTPPGADDVVPFSLDEPALAEPTPSPEPSPGSLLSSIEDTAVEPLPPLEPMRYESSLPPAWSPPAPQAARGEPGLSETFEEMGEVLDDTVEAEPPSEPDRTRTGTLPPGFDEVAKALGSTGNRVRYAPPAMEAAEAIPTPPFSPGERPKLPPLQAPPVAWEPPPVEPYDPNTDHGQHARPGSDGRKRSALPWVILVLAGLGGGGYYWYTTAGPGASSAGPEPSPAATQPAPVAAPSVSPEAGDEATMAAEEPPTLESLVGLPEPEPAPMLPGAAPETAPTPSPRPPAAVASDGVTGLSDVTWRQEPGRTVVTLVGNGPFDPARYTTFRLTSGTPREVVRLLGITEPFARSVLPVDGEELAQVRLGYHDKPSGAELHVVLDLVDDGVRVDSLEITGATMTVVLTR